MRGAHHPVALAAASGEHILLVRLRIRVRVKVRVGVRVRVGVSSWSVICAAFAVRESPSRPNPYSRTICLP